MNSISSLINSSGLIGTLKELLVSEGNLGSADSRSKERFRRVFLSALAMGVAKVFGMAATLLTVPLTAPYLGPERFGLFMTLGAVPLFMSFSDFGIGGGLLTEFAKANGRGDRRESRTLVSSTFFILLAISAIVALLGACLCLTVPWASVLGLTSAVAKAEAAPALFVFVACTAINMPLSVVQAVQQGFQESYVTNIALAFGNLLSLVLLLCSLHLRLQLPWMVGAIAGGPVISAMANWITCFFWIRPELAPRIGQIRLRCANVVLRTGLMIFTSQLGSAILLSCPVFLLAHTAGANTVAPFSVLQRIYSVFVVASSMLMTPLWPAYGEAHARGDFAWVRTTFFRSLRVTAAMVGVPLFLLALLSPHIIPLVTKGSVAANVPLGLATALMCFLYAIRHCVCMMVNGCGYLRRTAIAFPIGALFATSYLLMTRHPTGTFVVPLWIAGAEALVLVGVSLDVNRVLRFGSSVSLSSGSEMPSVATAYPVIPVETNRGVCD